MRTPRPLAARLEPGTHTRSGLPLPDVARPGITPSSSVLAVIPHFRCEEWLADCIESLLGQTRPPERIVVVDDASGRPPASIVERYPTVTLLTTHENHGPYRIVQQVIDETSFDVYMFQDADDWSAPHRLELQLEVAAAEGAELVGSHYCMVHCADLHCRPKYFPADVNAALSAMPTMHALQHPTSIVSGSLLARLGGFATGMRFSGDTELLRRAAHVARVVNVQEVLYFRRDRDGALTASAETGLQSPARLEVRKRLAERARRNARAAAEGRPLDLTPLSTGPAVGLVHVVGPRLPAPRQRRRAA
jgi:hypothetical protein